MKRVMVVEDENLIRESLVDFFHDEGFGVSSASNGREALRQLQKATVEQLPQVLVLDLMMPELDGRGFRAAQQADPALRPIRVLLMSANSNVADTARELGCDAAMAKPLDLDRLLATVNRLAGD